MPNVECRYPELNLDVVRENTEGEYSSIGGRMFPGTEREFVIQDSIFTRVGVDRVLKYAFELASTRPRKLLTSATKSNGIIHTMPFWDERVAAIAGVQAAAHYGLDVLAENIEDNASNVTREIKKVGLAKEYADAQKAGKVSRSSRSIGG